MFLTGSDLTAGSAHVFHTTQWSIVLAAKAGNSSTALAALENLCRIYWSPLYAFLRRQGRSPHDAQDLTQAFFAHLLQRAFLDNVDPHRGKFRSFLLASLKHFLCDEWDKIKAGKRGGGQMLISLSDQNAEELYLREPDPRASAEVVFDKRWALTLLARAMEQLRQEYDLAGKASEYHQLKRFLSMPTSDGAYGEVAAHLRASAETVAVKVHRLRHRYGELIRGEIIQTVANPEEVEEELRHLFAAMGR
ncbi:MAG: sigma-70 family RNA polymerase sigma factor [Verrucomicrobiota bacterium]